MYNVCIVFEPESIMSCPSNVSPVSPTKLLPLQDPPPSGKHASYVCFCQNCYIVVSYLRGYNIWSLQAKKFLSSLGNLLRVEYINTNLPHYKGGTGDCLFLKWSSGESNCYQQWAPPLDCSNKKTRNPMKYNGCASLQKMRTLRIIIIK